MEKDLTYTELFELYQGLLTKRQREIFESYYMYDLSLSEIAEPEGTTRQSVHEAIKKVKSKLREYESTLNVQKKNVQLREIAKAVEKTDKELAQKIYELAGR